MSELNNKYKPSVLFSTPCCSGAAPSDFELMSAMMQRVTLLEKTVRSQAQEIKCRVITQLLHTSSNTPYERAEISLECFLSEGSKDFSLGGEAEAPEPIR